MDADTPSPPAPERADLRAWLAVIAGTLCVFMALLDVSVVNAAMPVVQGEIGATPSEATWVGTGYLVPETVIIPLTAWLERLVGLRLLLLIGSIGFTVFSVLCGLAPDLTSMIASRFGQGLFGGTLVPTALTICATRLPPAQQAAGMAVVASAALMGPALGPLIGGWITEYWSWRYAFFMNVPICIGLVALMLIGLPRSRHNLTALREADWFGIFGMALGLGSLTVLLEKGHTEQWFDSALIQRLTAVMVAGFAMVTYGQLRARRPVLKLGLLADRSLASVVSVMTIAGAIMFVVPFLTPQFLAAIAGFNAFQSGRVVFVSGFASLLGALTYPVAIRFLDVRVILACGLLILGTSSYMSSALSPDSAREVFLVPQILLGIGLTSLALPLQQLMVASVSLENASEASSLFAISRNLGGSFGLAALASFQDQRMEFHHWMLASALPANSADLQQQMASASATLGGGPAGMDAAYGLVDGQVMMQALVMSFNDCFFALAVLAVSVIPLVLLIRKTDLSHAGPMAH